MKVDPRSASRTPRLSDVLGPLAAPVIEIVVARGRASVGEVLEALEELNGRRHAYTTVMTIMSRLFERGLLARGKEGRHYVYQPANSESDLIDQLSEQAVGRVIDRYGTAAFRQFALKVADLDPELRGKLIDLASTR